MVLTSSLLSLDVLAFSFGLLVILLGVIISLRPYQGYRRNESRPMLLLAIGMLLITVIPALVEIIIIPGFIARFTSPGTGAISSTLVVSRLCESLGIVVILYSIHARHV